MREWFTVIMACLIIGVLLDGLRRMRAAKRNDMRMSLSMHKGTNKEDLEAYGSELPNGGARVVGKRDQAAAVKPTPKPAVSVAGKQTARSKSVAPAAKPADSSVSAAPGKPEAAQPAAARQEELDLDQHVPLLMNVDEEPRLTTEPTLDDEPDTERREPSFNTELVEDDEADIDQDAYDRVLFSGRSEAVQPDSREPQLGAAEEPEEVFVVRVMAPKGEVFVGAAIKEAILGAGMRFGSRKIFHMHQQDDGEGPIQFSLVNMVQPGVFDLHRMDENDTPGLSLFMTLPSDAESLPAYEAMVKTAKQLAENLGGELRDDQLSTLTPQTIEHNRARVAEYERKRQLARARV